MRLLAPETLFILRAETQLADRALVSLEQFALGGSGTVRGYRQNALFTDNGVLLTAEVLVPVVRFSDGLLQVAAFTDWGWGWNTAVRSQPVPDHLSSVGLGLRLRLGNQLTARLDWGIPLVPLNTNSSGTLQENGIHFSIFYTPF